MKKFFWFIGIAAMALNIVACEKKPDEPDVNNITEDGFYVIGEATGQETVTKLLSMSKGINEAADQTERKGMFEKYIVLQGSKDFTLAYVSGGKQTAYGASLAEFKADLTDPVYDSNPADAVFKGKLVVGDSAPKMKVSKTGLYHIVLDLNETNDLSEAQIVLCPVTMGVRGGMNSWGFTALTATDPSNDGITFTAEGQELAAGGEFKFAYNSAWKITLDNEGKVKANTNLGADCKPGGANIAVTEGPGKYKITLTYKLAEGEIANSFKYTIELQEASSAPETMYMIGQQFGTWDWASSDIVELVPIWGKAGEFWCTRYFNKADGFKFCSTKAWNGDFTGAGSAGYTVEGGNCFVPEDGFYTVYIDGNDNTVEISPAEVYGIGAAFSNPAEWDFDKAPKFVAEGQKLTIPTIAAEEVRLAVKVQPSVAKDGITGNGWYDWWKTEFIFFADGKIVYRGAGNDQDRIKAEAGKKIVLDFNAGTGAFEEGGSNAAAAFTEWLANPTTDFTLEDDITLESFTPAAEMTGNLNGNGKTITVKDAATPVIAVAKGAVKNVTFAGSFAATPGTEKLILAPIGQSYGEIENVINKATVTITGPAGQGGAETAVGATAAGIVGEAYGPIKGCKNEGKITADASGKDSWTMVAAGIVGFAGAAIEGCDNNGEVYLAIGSPLGRTKGMTEVSMKYDPTAAAAGIAAYAVSDASHAVTVSKCNNNAKISFIYDNLNANSSAVSRSPVAGIVANSGGDITDSHNKGEIYAKMVAPDRSAAYSAQNIILHAAGVQGSDYFVKKIKSTVDQNETSVIDCTNSGKIVADSDMTKSNNTVGGVSAWPAAESASVTTIKNCTNSGDIEIKGMMKIRAGGVAGGTNNLEGCKNTGNMLVEGADATSVFGLINGFHTQTHTLKACEASGKLESKLAVSGIGGLCGGIGNVANTICEGCKVNATLVGGGTAQVGLVVGHLNGNSKNITMGTTEEPIRVAGSVDGTAATADNFMSLIHKATNYKEGTHIFNVVFGN